MKSTTMLRRKCNALSKSWFLFRVATLRSCRPSSTSTNSAPASRRTLIKTATSIPSSALSVPKAVGALPFLLKSFETTGVHDSGLLSLVIAAIGLPTQAEVDTVLDTYPKSRIRGNDDPVVVLKGIPDEFATARLSSLIPPRR